MPGILYNKSTGKRRTIWLHTLCWAAFISYEVSVSYILTGHFSPLLSYIFFYTFNISLFYVHALSVLPVSRADGGKMIWSLPLLIAAELLLYILLSVIASNFVSGKPAFHFVMSWKIIAAVIWRGIYFLLYGTGYFFIVNYIRRTKWAHQKAIEMERLKNQLLVAQKDFLRAQVNPHLLFNTLNFIKYAARRRPEEADEAIMILSDIMRFSLEENEGEFIVLSRELKQIENLIRLNKLRFEDRFFLEYRAYIETNPILVIPVLLLTLTENLFKHGNLSDENRPACLAVTASTKQLSFFSSNLPIKRSPGARDRPSTGLNNIKSRLESYYPGRHNFVYGMNGDVFEVELTIFF